LLERSGIFGVSQHGPPTHNRNVVPPKSKGTFIMRSVVKTSALALGIAGAIALSAANVAQAASIPPLTAAVKNAAADNVTEVRWRGGWGWGPGIGFGIAGAAIAGAAIAGGPWYGGYYPAYGYYPPYYAAPYPYVRRPYWRSRAYWGVPYYRSAYIGRAYPYAW
jgi:hypothetical protein